MDGREKERVRGANERTDGEEEAHQKEIRREENRAWMKEKDIRSRRRGSEQEKGNFCGRGKNMGNNNRR